MVIHPESGKAVPDAHLQIAAMKLMMDVMDRAERLAPGWSVKSAPVEEIQAAVERMRDEVREAEEQAEAERERERGEDQEDAP